MSNLTTSITAARLLACLAVVGASYAQQSGAPCGRWEELKLPEESTGRLRSLRFEQDGAPWILLDGAPFYWNGREFHAPRSHVGPLLAPLRGGFDRPLYAAQRPEGNRGRLFQLVDGDCRPAMAYYHDVPHEPPAVHVSRTGQLFHWGNQFLSVWVDGAWRRSEAALDHRLTFVFETEERVWFYFNQSLYAVDRFGKVEHRQIDCPLVDARGGSRLHGARWGDERMILCQDGTREVYAYELRTGKAVALPSLRAALRTTRVHDVFAPSDGAVWFAIHDWSKRRFVFLRMDPSGAVATIEETGDLGWRNLRHWSHTDSIRDTTDGALWFGTRYRGVGRYADGEMETFGWRRGITGDFRFLVEGLGGTVYAASEDAVYAFYPDEPPRPTPQWVAHWDELPFGFSEPFADGNGLVWWVRPERPKTLSRWDGKSWRDIEVPFDPRRISRWLAGDRGHLMVCMNRYPDGCYDVSAEGVQHFRDVRDMLAAAYRRGAARFNCDPSLQGCVRSAEGRLWFGYQDHRSIHTFDGERWSELHLGEPVLFVYESQRHGVIVRTRNDRFHTYDCGQLVELPYSLERASRWLLGSRSLQPFEDELLWRRPGVWAPVERGADGRWSLLAPSQESKEAQRASRDWHAVAPLPEKLSLVSRAQRGHWSQFPRTPRWRILGDTIVTADLRDSPLANRAGEIQQTFEDRAGNVWFVLKLASGYVQTFRLRTGAFRLSVKSPKLAARYRLTLRPTATLDGEPVADARIFWRFRGGTWHGGEPGGSITIPFTRRGLHRLDLVAMDRLGALTPKPAALQVEAVRASGN